MMPQGRPGLKVFQLLQLPHLRQFPEGGGAIGIVALPGIDANSGSEFRNREFKIADDEVVQLTLSGE